MDGELGQSSGDEFMFIDHKDARSNSGADIDIESWVTHNSCGDCSSDADDELEGPASGATVSKAFPVLTLILTYI